MKITRRLSVLTAVAVGAALALTACSGGGSSSSGSSGGTVKVGVLLSFTGPNGPTGMRTLAGMKIAQSQINAAGGVLGKKIQLVQGDDQGVPATGVSQAQKLLGENVAVMINGVTSEVALATQPVIARAGVMNVLAFSSADNLLTGKVAPDTVRINASNAMTGAVIGDYVNSQPNFKKITIVEENDSYGIGQVQAIRAELKNNQQVKVIQINYTDTDFRVALQTAKSAGGDATIVVDAASDTGIPTFLQQYKSAGLTAPVMVAATDLPQTAAAAAGGASEGVISAETYLADQPPYTGYPGSKYLVKEYAKVSKDVPNHEVAVGYTALQLWAAAANKAKSTDAAAVTKAMKGQSFTDTPFGNVSFDKTGQLSGHLQLYKIVGGKIQSFDVTQ